MGQPIPNDTNGGGRFRFVNISGISRLKVATIKLFAIANIVAAN